MEDEMNANVIVVGGGPAGYGKTVAASSWLEASDSPNQRDRPGRTIARSGAG